MHRRRARGPSRGRALGPELDARDRTGGGARRSGRTRRGERLLRRRYLVTLGIEPTHAATGFGYIEQAGDDIAAPTAPLTTRPRGGPARSVAGAGALRDIGARAVARFVEKPDREQAERFLSTGRFFWNAGMFVVRARVLLDELAQQIPGLSYGVRTIAATAGTREFDRVLEETWPSLTAIAIDHAVAEPLSAAGEVAVVPAGFEWDDVGDFAALARRLRDQRSPDRAPGEASVPKDSTDFAVAGASGRATEEGSEVLVLGTATVQAAASTATVYSSTGRHIAVVGVDDISIVDTEDALLVLADGHAQDVSRLVAGLEAHGYGHLR